MKRRLLKVMGILFVLVIGITVYFTKYIESHNQKASSFNKGELLVDLNELEQLTNQAVVNQNSTNNKVALEELNNKYTEFVQKIKKQTTDNKQSDMKLFVVSCMGIVVLFIIFTYLYIVKEILGPFSRMKKYVGQIAKGDFKTPLQYDRHNYFGDFTWAFDEMRCEISRARACEQEAIENNKTVIATLSHDIKTPIASIRAYAEGLEANFDNTTEKRALYTQIIMKKCDEVATLTEDLFIHSLSDLNKLKITTEKTDLVAILREEIQDMNTDQTHIILHIEEDHLYSMLDRKRFIQVMENLINNACKYAKTDIEIKVSKKEDLAVIRVRDFGTGISDKDMPFVLQKFYRGENSKDEKGAGLGLYIVNYIIKQMNGEVLLTNMKNGLEVTLLLPICQNENLLRIS